MKKGKKSEHKDKCSQSNSLHNNDFVQISINEMLDLLYWARRYCDGRATYAPTDFNRIYQRIRSSYPDLLRCKDQFDPTLKDKGKYWPYCQDGMYNASTGSFDARLKPREVSNEGENREGSLPV